MSPLSRRDFLKVLGVLAATPVAGTLLPASAQRLTAKDDHPNVIFLVFDTLSAGHASLYGYPRRTTPNLERFAAVSTVYHQHWAAGNFTLPGTASLLTGTYPWSHRGLHFYGKTLPAFERRNLFAMLPSLFRDAYTHNNLAYILLDQYRPYLDHLTPVEALCLYDDRFFDNLFPGDFDTAFYGEERIRGYRPSLNNSLVLALLGKAHYWLTTRRLKAEYASRYPLGLPDNYNDQIFLLEDAMDWIAQRCSNLPQPFLGYYHLWPPHEPYAPRAEFIGRFDDVPAGVPDKPPHFFTDGVTPQTLAVERTHYDEYLAYADAEFGRLLDALEAGGRLEDSIIIFTSDHGQMFERGIHAHVTPVLYEPLLHVPLLIHLPGQRTRQDVRTPTSAVDVLPTLAHLLGITPTYPMEGRILPPFLPAAERPIFALEAKESAKWGKLEKATFALRLGDYKLIYSRGYPQLPEGWELYNLKEDPEELENRFAHDPQAGALQSLLIDTLQAQGLWP